MASSSEHRKRAGDLLSQAASAKTFGERSRLIKEAAYWHGLAHFAENAGDPAPCAEPRSFSNADDDAP